MADYNINANITANTKGYEAGINKVQKTTKTFSASLSKVIQGLGKNGLVGAMGSIGLASAGLSATLGAVVKIAKQVSQAIGECTEAYKKQLIAERQLETAINNNPLVTGSAKKRLTEFANEMQKVSNYGDEELIPMMANLVSLGRTEEETMKIMAVAMDMSASGSMSLDTAINQLNATLNGNIGRLGQQNAELKGLTEEELKSGKAIEILGDKFKGLSQATLDTSKQLKNIKGDFKEAIGEFTLPTSDMWNKFWIGFYDKGISVIKQFDEYMDKTIIGKGIAEELIKGYKSISDERQKVLYLEDNIHALSETQIVALQKHLESTKNRNKEQEELLRKVKMEVEARTYLAKIYEDMDTEEAERQKTEEEQLAIENEIAILKGQYLEKMAEQERKWENIKDVTGEQVSNEEKIKFYQDSLVDLMTKANGQITTNNQLYKDQIAIIQKLQAELEPEEKATSDTWAKKIREQAIERLETEKEVAKETARLQEASDWEIYQIEREYNQKIKKLALQRLDEEEAEALKSVENYANAEEEKARITEYYQKERADLVDKYTAQYKDTTQKELEKTEKEWKIHIKKIGDMFKTLSQTVSKTMKSIGGLIKKAFTKAFKFNPDEALDSLLAFEDSVLTFFVETLPKLPQFFASAVQSISVLFQTLANVIKGEQIAQIIGMILQNITRELPVILESGIKIGSEIIGGIVQGLIDNADLVMEAIEMVFDVLIKFIPEIVGFIVKLIVKFAPKIIDGIIKVIPKIFSASGKLLSIILEAVTKLISVMLEKLPELLETLIPQLLNAIVSLVPVLIKNIGVLVTAFIDVLPVLITSLIKGLTEFISNLSAEDIAEIIKGVISMVGQIASALIKNIAKLVAELIPLMVTLTVELIKSIPDILKGLATGIWEGIVDIGSAVWEGIKGIGEGIKNIGSSIISGIKSLFGFANGTNNAPRGIALVGEKGPELVRFNGGEQVLNTRNTQKALQNAGKGGSVFNVTFNNTQDTTAFAMMRELRNYQRNLAFNGVL